MNLNQRGTSVVSICSLDGILSGTREFSENENIFCCTRTHTLSHHTKKWSVVVNCFVGVTLGISYLDKQHDSPRYS